MTNPPNKRRPLLTACAALVLVCGGMTPPHGEEDSTAPFQLTVGGRELRIQHGPADTTAMIVVAASSRTFRLAGSELLVGPMLLQLPVHLDAHGEARLPLPEVLSGVPLWFQAAVRRCDAAPSCVAVTPIRRRG